jgi:hypothetical protein
VARGKGSGAKKRAGLTKNKRIKAIARRQVGSSPAARVFVVEAEREKPKHKKSWDSLLDE